MESRDSFYAGHDTLEPLDVVGLPPPFHHIEYTPSLSDGTFLDETPTTATTSLPTPGLPPPSPGVLDFADHPPSFHYSVFPAQWDQPPPAPRLNDLDSFTEGTGVGSFDFSLRSSCSSEHLSGRQYLDPPAIRSSYSSERLSACPPPAHDIEVWRDEVLLSTSSEPPQPSTTSTTTADHDPIEETTFPPTFTSWKPSHRRAPKRQLSSTSVDRDCKRGRKFIRRGGGMFMPRFWNISPGGSPRGHEPEVDHERRARSSSAPDIL